LVEGERRGEVADYTDADIAEWAHIIELMHGNAILDHDAAAVYEGSDNISSGAGLYNSLPSEIANLIYASVQTGYGHAIRAIRAVREGKVQGLGPVDEYS
jgi:hypothetical protein